jgi:hypothetical protein
MARNPNKQPCERNGCKNYAQRGSSYCRSHAPNAPPPNARGAEAANANAQRHGLYSHFFHPDDLEALAAVSADSGLDDEIALTRVAIRRLAEYIENAGTTDEAISLAQALFAGAGRVAGLLKTQRSLTGQAADGIAGAIGQALDELGAEWGTQL